MHLDLDRATPTHIQYWEALLVVCDWELAEARKKDALDWARLRGEHLPLAEERGLHASIEEDVKRHLERKTYGELEVLQSQIESHMRSGKAKVVEYWEAVLERLRIFKAKACLREIHAQMLRKHLEHLEQPEDIHEEKDAVEPILGDETQEAEAEKEGADGSCSPQLLHDNGDNEEEAIDPEEDRAILEKERIAVVEERRKQGIVVASRKKKNTADDNMFERRALKAMGGAMEEEGDAVFAFGSNEEVNIETPGVDSEVYWWHDKYRPRKPKYINRVHTGFEWNKYNRENYDGDNLPPKMVQGYKFNIFYLDLVDKTKTPSYTIDKDGDSSETCIIRFHAGPPYEDIAFRIVNAEWEYSHKKGYKCTFERRIRHLYFNFKRPRYCR